MFIGLNSAITGLTQDQLSKTINSLFSKNEQGVWYDPSDLSTLFQDAAGTTPVTAVEQPVGRMLDKSGRGNHATQATTTSRPTLKQDASGKYYLSFDGVDDGLVTPSIDFTGTNKMTVFAGVRKLSDAGTGVVAELSSDISTNNRCFTFLAPSIVGSYRFFSRATVLQGAGNGIFAPAPDTSVITGIGDISGDIVSIRRNGSLIETNTFDQGTGNYGNYPLYIGRRGGTSLPFNGQLYGLVIRGALSSTGEIQGSESYMNLHTGAY